MTESHSRAVIDRQWRWSGTDVRAERGFWALGEAIVDAVVARYPTVFDGSGMNEIG